MKYLVQVDGREVGVLYSDVDVSVVTQGKVTLIPAAGGAAPVSDAPAVRPQEGAAPEELHEKAL